MENFWLFFLSLVAVAVPFLDSNVLEQQNADRVVNLPGTPPVKFRHYAGHIDLNSSKSMFYWFFESEDGAAQKPLVLWLNGGPGCSSVAEGAAQEIGPFLLEGSQFVRNPFSWNKAANMLFLETPVGVGFSYSKNSIDYELVSDESAAEDNFDFLVNWYARFPEYKWNELYISGESYAGHFAPQLARHILERNGVATKGSLIINLKGIMMGNPVMNDVTDMQGTIDFAWSHGIISDRISQALKRDCDFSRYNKTRQCEMALQSFIAAVADIDIFNIYRPSCLSFGNSSSSKLDMGSALHGLFRGKTHDQCQDYASPSFNRLDVQMALHANVTGLPYPFFLCSPLIKKWNDYPYSVLPTIQKLLDAGVRIWIFSGDIDGRVPVTGTRYSLREMGLLIKEELRPWFDDHQVAGWVQTYQGGLTLVTVRGAGHQVPVDKPRESLTLFRHFLSNTSLPATR